MRPSRHHARLLSILIAVGAATRIPTAALASATNGVPPLPAPSLRQLSLAEARRRAFARNWDLLAARSDVDIAVAQRIVAREFPNPTLSLGTTKINVDRSPARTRLGNDVWARSYDTTAAIGQLFELGGKRSIRRLVAETGIRGAEARLADARRILDLGVTSAYVAVLQADANVRILKESAASLRKEAQIAERRLNAGDISPSDRSQIDIAAQRIEIEAGSAVAAANNARVDLEVLLGETTPSGNWVPTDTLESLVEDLTASEVRLPVLDRPDLVAARAEVDRSEAQLRLQRAARIPDPTVVVQYEHEPPDQGNTVGLGVLLPLPLWNRNRGNIASAEATRAQASNELHRVEARIAAEVASTRARYEAAVERRKRYVNDVVPGSGNVRRTVAFAYEKGGASLLDLLSAERNDNEVRLAAAQATADAAIAAANLRAALNLLKPAPAP